MKSLKWALVALMTALATPALAETADGKDNKAVWIALGVVFMGSFTAISTSLYASYAAKKKKQAEEE